MDDRDVRGKCGKHGGGGPYRSWITMDSSVEYGIVIQSNGPKAMSSGKPFGLMCYALDSGIPPLDINFGDALLVLTNIPEVG